MVRAWHVFFCKTAGPFGILARGGFGHVMAAGYDPEHKLWIFFNPTRTGTLIEALPEGPACAALYCYWCEISNPRILRVVARTDRFMVPPMFSCVAAIKALLGVRCRALLPRGLYRDLVAKGAEVLEVPQSDEQHIRITVSSAAGSERRSDASAGSAAGRGRSHELDTAAATAGNLSS